MQYMARLPSEFQGMFAHQMARQDNYHVLATNAQFTRWAMDNAHMFSADK
jgi:hypothetical protein